MRTPYGWRVEKAYEPQPKAYAHRPPPGQAEWLDGHLQTAADFRQACRRVRQALRASQVRQQMRRRRPLRT